MRVGGMLPQRVSEILAVGGERWTTPRTLPM